MTDFATLQDLFQKAVLDGDDAVIPTLAHGAFADRRDMLNVYRVYHKMRLVGVLRNHYRHVHAYVGTDAFEASAKAYVAARPSRHHNARVYARDYPRFLAETEPYKEMVDICELSLIELAVNDAFDAADANAPSEDELRNLRQARLPRLTFAAHPSVTHLGLTTNAFAIWSALAGDGQIPAPLALDQKQSVFVWRGDATPCVRAGTAEEARLWIAMLEGRSFGDLCALVATDDEAESRCRVCDHVSRWLTDGLLASVAQSRSIEASM